MRFSPDTMIIFYFFLCCLAINCLFSNSVSVPSALHRHENGMGAFKYKDSLQVYEKEYEMGEIFQYDVKFFSNIKHMTSIIRVLCLALKESCGKGNPHPL